MATEVTSFKRFYNSRRTTKIRNYDRSHVSYRGNVKRRQLAKKDDRIYVRSNTSIGKLSHFCAATSARVTLASSPDMLLTRSSTVYRDETTPSIIAQTRTTSSTFGGSQKTSSTLDKRQTTAHSLCGTQTTPSTLDGKHTASSTLDGKHRTSSTLDGKLLHWYLQEVWDLPLRRGSRIKSLFFDLIRIFQCFIVFTLFLLVILLFQLTSLTQ